MSDENKKDNIEKLKDVNIFGDKKYSDLLSEIYEKSGDNNKEIVSLIEKLSAFLTNAQTASIVGPVLGDYLDNMIKNDEQLIKLASIIQKHYKDTTKISKSDSDDSMIPKGELEEIRQAVREREGKIVKMGS